MARVAGGHQGVFPSVYLPSVVGPATELEFASLIIKREPCNVYLARALKDARRDVEAAPVLVHHHVRLERAVELFVGAAVVQWQVDGVVVGRKSCSSGSGGGGGEGCTVHGRGCGGMSTMG